MKIFISSTSYDLFDLRSFLVSILENLGHTVIYHESPTFPAKFNLHSHDQCIEAVKNADLVICLVDKRYGGKYRGKLFHHNRIALKFKLRDDEIIKYKYKDLSITWLEVKTAYDSGIPVITFARTKTLDEKEVRRKNQKIVDFIPAYVEKNEVFDFLDWITKKPINNWIVPFYNFIDFQTKMNIYVRELDNSISVNSESDEVPKLQKILILVEGEQDRKFIKNLINKMNLVGEFLILPTYSKFSVLKNFDTLIKDNIDKFDYILVVVDSDEKGKNDINFNNKFDKLNRNQEKVKLFFAIENIEEWIEAGLNKNVLPKYIQSDLVNNDKIKYKRIIHNFVPDNFDWELAKEISEDFQIFCSFLEQFKPTDLN
ncbi:DUF4062 domain-containing protein [Acinetobacter baumannii]